MYVRLKDSPKGPAGKWTDAQSGEHGDLLDVIREALGLIDFADVIEEARSFLSLPHPEPELPPRGHATTPAPSGSPEASRRLIAMAQPIAARSWKRIAQSRHYGFARNRKPALPSALLLSARRGRPDGDMARDDRRRHGSVRPHHRGTSNLARADGSDKAPNDPQRKAMGDLLGHAVRFGIAGDVMAAGEGIETVLSARQAIPAMRWRRRSHRHTSLPSCSPTRCDALYPARQ